MNKTGDALMCVLPSNTVLVTVPGYPGRIRTTKQDTKRGYYLLCFTTVLYLYIK